MLKAAECACPLSWKSHEQSCHRCWKLFPAGRPWMAGLWAALSACFLPQGTQINVEGHWLHVTLPPSGNWQKSNKKPAERQRLRQGRLMEPVRAQFHFKLNFEENFLPHTVCNCKSLVPFIVALLQCKSPPFCFPWKWGEKASLDREERHESDFWPLHFMHGKLSLCHFNKTDVLC